MPLSNGKHPGASGDGFISVLRPFADIISRRGAGAAILCRECDCGSGSASLVPGCGAGTSGGCLGDVESHRGVVEGVGNFVVIFEERLMRTGVASARVYVTRASTYEEERKEFAVSIEGVRGHMSRATSATRNT
jgi:hypothetical protein